MIVLSNVSAHVSGAAIGMPGSRCQPEPAGTVGGTHADGIGVAMGGPVAIDAGASDDAVGSCAVEPGPGLDEAMGVEHAVTQSASARSHRPMRCVPAIDW